MDKDIVMGYLCVIFFGFVALKGLYVLVLHLQHPEKPFSELADGRIGSRSMLAFAIVGGLCFAFIGGAIVFDAEEKQRIRIEAQEKRDLETAQAALAAQQEKAALEKKQEQERLRQKQEQERLRMERERAAQEAVINVAMEFCGGFLENDMSRMTPNVATRGSMRTISDRDMVEQLDLKGPIIMSWIDMTFGRGTARSYNVENVKNGRDEVFFDLVVYSDSKPAVTARNIRMLKTTEGNWAVDGESFLYAIDHANN